MFYELDDFGMDLCDLIVQRWTGGSGLGIGDAWITDAPGTTWAGGMTVGASRS